MSYGIEEVASRLIWESGESPYWYGVDLGGKTGVEVEGTERGKWERVADWETKVVREKA